MRISQIILLFLAILGADAQALEITALGGVGYASPTERQNGNNDTWTGDSATGYGVAVSDDLFTERLELETGIFSLGSQVEGTILGESVSQTLRALQIPFLLRFHFDPWLSVAAGGYVSFGQGNVTTVTNGNSVSQSYDDARLSSLDAGLLLSLKAKLHITDGWSAVIDARYQHGLKNRELDAGAIFNTRSIQVLAGLGYEF